MNFKTTYFLVGALVVVVVLFAVLGKKADTDVSTSDLVFPTLKAPKGSASDPARDITRVEIDRTGPPPEKLVFERPAGETRWRMKWPYDARVQSSTLDRLVGDCVRLRRDERISSKLPKDLAANGLAPPAVTITLFKGEQSWKLGLGNDTPGEGYRKMVYVLSSDRPGEPLAIHYQDVQEAYKTAKDFRDKNLVLESALNALEVTLNDGQREVALKKVDDPGKTNLWQFTNPAYGEADYEGEGTGNMPAGKPVQRVGSVRDLLVAIEQMRLRYHPEQKIDDFVAENVSEKELAEKYGLEKGKPATLRIAVKSRPGGLLGGDEKKPPVEEALLIGKKVPPSKGEPKAELLPQPKVIEDKPDAKDKDTGDSKDKPDAKPNDGEAKDKGPATKDQEPPAEEDWYYARLESENNVVQISGKNIPIILAALADPGSMRNKDLAVFEVKNVDAIDIKTPTSLVKLRKLGEPEKWRLVEENSVRDADASAVLTLMNMLTVRRQVKDFPTAPDEKLGLDDKSPTATVTVWENGIKEKKDVKADIALGKETVKLVFSTKPEKEVVYVKRIKDKDAITLAVAEKILPSITEGKLGYLDKALPLVGFEDEITKLVVVRRDDNATFELLNEKEKKEDKLGVWKIKQPAEHAGRKADLRKVDRILDIARTLHAEKLIAEKAGDMELAGWGLKPALYEITMTVKKGDKSEDRVYLFGQQNEKNDGRYARLGERDLVFLVRPEVIAPVDPKVKDLVDLDVLSFDPAKLREIKISGLADGDKRVTLNVELRETKPGEARAWVLKNEADLKNFKLNGARVTELATLLSRLSASQFLVFKKGPKPEHKLDAKDRALEVEVYLEGDDKKPRKLTLGALLTEGDLKGYAAQTDALMGDVFLLPEKPLADLLKEGLAYFGKRE